MLRCCGHESFVRMGNIGSPFRCTPVVDIPSMAMKPVLSWWIKPMSQPLNTVDNKREGLSVQCPRIICGMQVHEFGIAPARGVSGLRLAAMIALDGELGLLQSVAGVV